VSTAPDRHRPEGNRPAGNRLARNVVVTVAVLVGIVIVLNIVANGLDNSVGGSEPSGEPGSSYATGPDGLAAYAQLLADYGHPVQRQRGELAETTLDHAATLILTESDRPAPLDADEVAAVRSYLALGGRVVLVEPSAADVEAITGFAPETTEGERTYRSFDPALGPLREVQTSGDQAYEPSNATRVLASERGHALLVTPEIAPGEVLLLSEAGPVENEMIGDADNAAFGLALAGDDEQPVVFAEGVHGYGERSGLAAIPNRWKVALLTLGAGAVVFAWSRARRLGPPDQPTRVLPPARSMYVDAMARTLAQTNDRARALAPLGEWARDRVRQRAGLASDARPEAVGDAARQLGLDDAEIATLWRPPATEDEVIALGRAVARLTDERTAL
jgi:hypothetical protein